jgi:hypothetical protein
MQGVFFACPHLPRPLSLKRTDTNKKLKVRLIHNFNPIQTPQFIFTKSEKNTSLFRVISVHCGV